MINLWLYSWRDSSGPGRAHFVTWENWKQIAAMRRTGSANAQTDGKIMGKPSTTKWGDIGKIMGWYEYGIHLTINQTWLGKLKIAIYSGFTRKKWWFSIAMLNYQRVTINQTWLGNPRTTWMLKKRGRKSRSHWWIFRLAMFDCLHGMVKSLDPRSHKPLSISNFEH